MLGGQTVVDANPFAFKAYDEKMHPDNAPNYIPPEKRRQIKEYLTKSSLQYYQQSKFNSL